MARMSRTGKRKIATVTLSHGGSASAAYLYDQKAAKHSVGASELRSKLRAEPGYSRRMGSAVSDLANTARDAKGSVSYDRSKNSLQRARIEMHKGGARPTINGGSMAKKKSAGSMIGNPSVKLAGGKKARIRTPGQTVNSPGTIMHHAESTQKTRSKSGKAALRESLGDRLHSANKSQGFARPIAAPGMAKGAKNSVKAAATLSAAKPTNGGMSRGSHVLIKGKGKNGFAEKRPLTQHDNRSSYVRHAFHAQAEMRVAAKPGFSQRGKNQILFDASKQRSNMNATRHDSGAHKTKVGLKVPNAGIKAGGGNSLKRAYVHVPPGPKSAGTTAGTASHAPGRAASMGAAAKPSKFNVASGQGKPLTMHPSQLAHGKAWMAGKEKGSGVGGMTRSSPKGIPTGHIARGKGANLAAKAKISSGMKHGGAPSHAQVDVHEQMLRARKSLTKKLGGIRAARPAALGALSTGKRGGRFVIANGKKRYV